MSNMKYALNLKPIAKKETVVSGAQYRFTILTDRLIRLEYQQDGRFVDEPTQTVICRDFPAVAYRVIDREDSLEIVTDKLHLYYDKKPFSQVGLRIELTEGYHIYGSVWNYGDGIHDLKGTAQTLDGADGAIELDSGILSRDGFTVLDDSKSAFIEEDQWARAKDRESIDLYFFGYGHDYLGCLKDFYHLTGATPLLPRFALGNWWSRFYRYTEESYLELMNKFRQKGIAFSTAVIDMDWHLTDIPQKYGSGWTGYTWNPAYFPDPKRFMDKLHEMGMRVTLNVHPADGVRGHEEAYLPMAKELGIDWENEDKIPFDVSDRKFMEAYFKYLHHPNEERGVDFWWLDWQQGSRGSAVGLDTLWMLNHLHFIDSGRSGRKPLTFSRYAGLGSHRYPIGFSGDTYSTWESLDFQPYFTANASNAGYSWWSHDIGGHQGGSRDDELAVRWLQFGVFSPIMRLHSTCNEFYGKEPWNYNMQAEKTMTEFLQLRHKLIPYLYSMNYLTHREGLPLMQPMYYHHDCSEAYKVPNEYYYGTEMIVCPITRPADPKTLLAEFDAWLPAGDWFDFFTGQHYKGGRKIKVYRNLETIPVFVRAGGIVPLAKDFMDSHLHNPETLELRVYNGADGSFDLYEDRGDGFAEAGPVVTHFAFTAGRTAELTIRIAGEAEGVIPAERSYEIHISGIAGPRNITADGGSLPAQRYDEAKKELTVFVRGGISPLVRIRIETGTEEIAHFEKKPVVYSILHKAQLPYALKTAVYEAGFDAADPARLLGKLYEIGLPESLMGAMVEQVIADL